MDQLNSPDLGVPAASEVQPSPKEAEDKKADEPKESDKTEQKLDSQTEAEEQAILELAEGKHIDLPFSKRDILELK